MTTNPQDREGALSSSRFLKRFIWTVLILADLVIGFAAAEKATTLSPVVFLLCAGGLFTVEWLLWNAVEGLFR